MANRGRLDWFLIVLLLALFSVGLVALYSAGGEERFWTQLQRGALGIALMLLIARLSLPVLQHAGLAVFVVILLMLVAVLVFGVKINNARRWLYVGFYIQPSELMKIFLPIGLAYCYARLPAARWWHHFAALVVVGIPALLVLMQPDFGTSALIIMGGLATVFVAGASWRFLSALFLLALGALPLVWSFVLKPYQQKRVLTMVDPYQDPLGAGYHTIQSQIAVGSGGVWGKGFQAGTQAQLGFLPERHTDFIFAVYAEEFGFAGAVLLLSLAALIAWRGLQIAARSANMFGCCAVAGVTATFFLTFAINLSMVSGLLPVVGMPLPLVSYGGTALLATFIGFGWVLGVSRNIGVRQ